MVYVVTGLLAVILMLPYRAGARANDVRPGTDFTAVVVHRKPRTTSRLAVAASFSLLAFIAAVRVGPGTDYWARYVPTFEYVRGGAQVDVEIGYLLVNRWIGDLTADVQWVFAVMSVLTIGLMYRFILRMSVNPALSIFIFVAGGFYLEEFNLVRQGLAIAILLNTIEFVLRREWLKFVVAVLVASTLHSSALIWLAVWPLLRVGGSRKVQIGFTLALATVILASPQVLKAMVETLAPGYAWYFESNYGEVRSFDPIGIVVAAFVLMVSISVAAKSDDTTAYMRSLMSLQGVQLAALLATISISYSFSRVTYYFVPIQLIAVPYVLSLISDRGIRQMATFVVCGLYIASFYFKFVLFNSHGVFPYESIFTR